MAQISIVTLCTTGYALFLAECLDSVQRQTYRDFEHIVILAGCLDDAQAVLKPYHNVKVLVIDDLGLCTSRNKGVDIASGKYVMNLDADDKIANTCLEHVIDRAEPHVIVCPGMYYGFSGEYGRVCPREDFTLEELKESNRIFCCSLFPRADFLAVGGYDRRLDWLGLEDWNLWVRLMKYGCRVKIVRECLFYYRVWPGSSSHRLAYKDRERYALVRKMNSEV